MTGYEACWKVVIMTYSEVVKKINSDFTVPIYWRHFDKRETARVIIHHFWERDDWISVKIECGRKFKKITVYREENGTIKDMQKKFCAEFEHWLNNTEDMTC